MVLRALGRTSFISEFVGSPSANPGYIYDLILIAIAVLGASLGMAILLVSAIVGVRLERRQGIVLGRDADGALGAAVASRFAPPASADPVPLFTPPVAPETGRTLANRLTAATRPSDRHFPNRITDEGDHNGYR